jgi:hypothetical protein
MNDVQVFLNCEIRDTSFLQYLGDACLAPTRYFFHGRTVEIFANQYGHLEGIHHVSSYHKAGVDHKSRTRPELFSESTSMGKTAWMIITLIPGFILGVLIKGLDYAMSAPMKTRHQVTMQHFMPRDVEIRGDSLEQIVGQLTAQTEQPYHCKINSLTIHGPAGLELATDMPQLHVLNPKKLILVGPKIGHPAAVQGERLDDILAATHRWATDGSFRASDRPMHRTLVKQLQVRSTNEALDHTPERRTLFSRFHQVYNVI